jgi:3-deoxy-manno-octulosonate cytidylyltransferase (CMP-KDO synthetase)
MEILVIIPARSASSRFPEKPLAELTAPDGIRRPLVEWTWRAASAAVTSSKVVVATDCEKIAATVERFGGRALITGSDLRNGTERCAAALDRLEEDPDLVVNLQGDSPLVPPAIIHRLVAAFAAPGVSVATPYVCCDGTTMDRILADASLGRVGATCVASGADGRALYFSKYPIPHGASAVHPLKLHLGVYAYRPEALRAYAGWPSTGLEQAEGLEQLRFLAQGWPVHLVEAELPPGGIWEVNNPADVDLVAPLLPMGEAPAWLNQ